MYIITFDLSLNSTGYCVFTDKGKFIDKGTIAPSLEFDIQNKLKFIADKVKKLKRKYDIKYIIIERGFSRFNEITQKLFRVVGLINYLFYDVEQIYITAKSVRKIICGNGNIKKEDFFMFIKDNNKKIKFNNNDEGDAYALGKAYFLQQKEVIKNGKKNI
jgi:Holliday junction resolvasome RuvABC endonuclease subunit